MPRSAQLQSQPAVWCHDFNADLKIGSWGGEVEALIIALKKEGFKIPQKTYIFDKSVVLAVNGFQEKYRNEILIPLGLKYGTGFVGKKTRAKLDSLFGCKINPPLSTPATPSTIQLRF
ncbi:MAG: peptidoglycan-binding domain-containing protein [Patescibacteria group bacterium]